MQAGSPTLVARMHTGMCLMCCGC